MIKELFLPIKTKNRRFISQRVIGISIEEEQISAAQIDATSSGTSIEKIIDEPIMPGAPDTKTERIAKALTSVLSKCSNYDQLRISVPSSMVTFKELTVPFLDVEKIKMIVEYEVEPQLPFSVNDAIIDFIITEQNKADQTSIILVAAVRKQDLQEIVDMYTQLGIDPDAITIDLISLYSLYLQIPEYSSLPGASVLVDIGSRLTSVAFLVEGRMRLVRNISKGLQTISENISNQTGKPIDDVLSRLKNFGTLGTDDELFNQTAQKQIINFLNEVQFTINSFSLKLSFYGEISRILFSGLGEQIRGLVDFGSTVSQVQCEHFSCNKLFKTKLFKNKTGLVATTWSDSAIALGTAIPYVLHEKFDLRKKEFVKTYFPLLNKQIVAGSIIIAAIFLIIGARGYFQIDSLQMIAQSSEESAIKRIKKIFPPDSKSAKKTDLPSLIKDASRLVTQRKEAWAPFMQENLKPLEILQDLTKTIDRRSFNVKIEKIVLKADEQGLPTATVSGVFVSRPGAHFTDHLKFVHYLNQQSRFFTSEGDGDPVELEEGKGVRFTLNLKSREKQV